MNQGN